MSILGTSSLVSATFFVNNGKLYSTGRNDFFQTGHSENKSILIPTIVPNLENVKMIAAGYAVTLTLSNDKNSVFCFGTAPWIPNKSCAIPQSIKFEKQINFIASGMSHCFAITTMGNCYGWGTNDSGELGLGSEQQLFATPTLLPFKEHTLMVSCGANFSLLLTKNKQVYSCGSNSCGQLGIGILDKKKTTPTLIDLPEKVLFVSSGRDHSLLITKNSQNINKNQTQCVWSFGLNSEGQLGVGSSVTIQNFPTKINNLPYSVVAIAAGWSHSMALTENGQVYTWGSNVSGQLGYLTNSSKSEPHLVPLKEKISKIYCGNCHSFVMTHTNTIYGWGYNGYGQLGTGDLTSNSTPIQIITNEKYDFPMGLTKIHVNFILKLIFAGNFESRFHKKIFQKSSKRYLGCKGSLFGCWTF